MAASLLHPLVDVGEGIQVAAVRDPLVTDSALSRILILIRRAPPDPQQVKSQPVYAESGHSGRALIALLGG
jgi:hypothetical protein